MGKNEQTPPVNYQKLSNLAMLKLMYASVLQTTSKVRKMAEAQALLSFLKYILSAYYGYVLFINIDNAKGWLLTALAVAMGALKVYFMYKKGRQALREKEYQLWELEREKRKRDAADTVK